MAEPVTPIRVPQPAGSPLYPLSQDRINQRMGTSPTKSDMMGSPTKSGRGTSEVQAKVAFLNRLSTATTPERPVAHVSTTTAALQRAILGREEAESALHSALAELSEANARERRVSERLESLVEEIHVHKERQAHERSVFEKEVRKARKEAFRAGSVLVKAQEELKYSRGEIKALKDEVNAEKEAKEKAKQEAFERAYALASLTEELETMKGRLRSFEAENQSETLEKRAQEIHDESPSRTSPVSENTISTPLASRGLKRGQPDSLGQSSPSRKRSLNCRDRVSQLLSPVLSGKDSATQTMQELYETEERSCGVIDKLSEDLRLEKRMRQKAEDMIHFLKMECQFQRCSCRVAENYGIRYVHDSSWAQCCDSEPQLDIMDAEKGTPSQETQSSPTRVEETQEPEEQSDEPLVTFCPDTGTFQVIPSPRRPLNVGEPEAVSTEVRLAARQASPTPSSMSLDSDNVQRAREIQDAEAAGFRTSIGRRAQAESCRPLSNLSGHIDEAEREADHYMDDESRADALPHHGMRSDYQTFTKTTTIPLHLDTKSSHREPAFCPIPDTPINREEALAQIRARRDRTQWSLKRSASANDASTKPGVASKAITPTRSRRIPGMENARGPGESSRSLGVGPRMRRDISAPVPGRRSFR